MGMRFTYLFPDGIEESEVMSSLFIVIEDLFSRMADGE